MYQVVCGVECGWFRTIYSITLLFIYFLQTVYFKIRFYLNKDKKECGLADSFSIAYSLSGETVTWVSCRGLVGSEQEPLIHPGSSIFSQG